MLTCFFSRISNFPKAAIFAFVLCVPAGAAAETEVIFESGPWGASFSKWPNSGQECGVFGFEDGMDPESPNTSLLELTLKKDSDSPCGEITLMRARVIPDPESPDILVPFDVDGRKVEAQQSELAIAAPLDHEEMLSAFLTGQRIYIEAYDMSFHLAGFPESWKKAAEACGLSACLARFAAGTIPADIQQSHVQPSFDCRKAGTAVEKAICQENDLARMDFNIATTWKALRALADAPEKKQMLQEQRAWLKQLSSCNQKAGNRMALTGCVSEKMQERWQALGYPWL